VNRPRVAKARAVVAQQAHRLGDVKVEALNALDDLRRAIERRRVPLRRLVSAARKAESVAGKLWSEASWLVERRDDLARARAGKRKRY
jgi:hypothetical protein